MRKEQGESLWCAQDGEWRQFPRISEDGESEVSRGGLFLSLQLTQQEEPKCSLSQEELS